MRATAMVASALLVWLLPTRAVGADYFRQIHGDALYKPSVGQEGKDVIWVPTPDVLMQAMLDVVKIQPNDLLYDLGSGDGKIVIGAAQRYGIKAVGIEYNPDLVLLAKRNAVRAAVSDKVTFIQGDIFKEDFRAATVLTLYLLPELNMKLKPIILAMRPGTRVVSNTFNMGTWSADTTIEVPGGTGYFWVVPAQVQGRWQLGDQGAKPAAELDIQQTFQMLSGRLLLNGESLIILSGRMQGEAIAFTYGTRTASGDQARGTFQGTVRAGALTGTLSDQGVERPMAGRRIGQER
jgi:hypothetical protein